MRLKSSEILCWLLLLGATEAALAVRQRWFEVSERKSVVLRPEKIEERPRLRFDSTISSKSVMRGSFFFDFGFAYSLSLMNSLNPSIL